MFVLTQKTRRLERAVTCKVATGGLDGIHSGAIATGMSSGNADSDTDVFYSPFTGLKPPPSRRENLQILRYHVAHD